MTERHRRGRPSLPFTITMLLAVPLGFFALQSRSAANDDEAIRGVILSAYVDGMHRNASRAAVEAGFHPGFYMFVRTPEDSIRHVTIDQWVSRLPAEGTPPEHEVSAKVDVLAREGGSAAARAVVYFDNDQVFTDYFLLYKLDGRWQLVGKIFESHR